MAQDETRLRALLRKLDRLSRIDDLGRRAILQLPVRLDTASPGQVLVREGDVPSECCVLIHGYACRHKSTQGGGRQIVSFHMDGDLLDLQHLKLERADHSVSTITPAAIGWIPKHALDALLHGHPGVADALWRDALIDASVFREWVLNVGRRDARSRIAHMLCEFAARREAAGLGPPERFELPMTQSDIADATGMTTVHVNRTLRALTEEGAIQREGRHIQITDWRRMCAIADFDPAYLHQAA